MISMLDSAAALETFLGDPCRADSVWSYEKGLRVDEDESFPQDAIDALNTWGLPAYYVPAQQHGGRFVRMDEMLYVLRAVARHDIAAAIAHAKTFLGSAAVWVAGSSSIQDRCADLIRAGQPVSLALTEFDHGGDLVANDCRLKPTADGAWQLDGEKWLINNATRSSALTVYVKHDGRKDAAAGTLVWIEKSRIGVDSYVCTPKIRTLGVRGADISGLRFRGVRVTNEDIIGKPGQGLDVTLRSLQLSRTLCSGLSIGAGDLAVRTLALFMRERVLYRKRLIEHGFGRERLAGVFLRQLIAECLAFGASRMMHVQPRSMSVVSSVAKYFVPELVDEVYEQCEQGLGARAYLRTAPWAHFQKAKRDHRLVGLFDGSSVVNLQSIAFQLPRLLNRSLAVVPVHGEHAALKDHLRQVFDVMAALPTLRLDALSILSNEPDATLRFVCYGLGEDDLRTLPSGVIERVLVLRQETLVLDAHVRQTLRTLNASAPEQFDAARRFSTLYAAASCFLVWYFNRQNRASIWDAAFVEGTWVMHAIDWLLTGNTHTSMADDLLPWLERIIEMQQAVSFMPLICPHATRLDTRALATCMEAT